MLVIASAADHFLRAAHQGHDAVGRGELRFKIRIPERMPSTLSNAATKCISNVPGLPTQTSTPDPTSVRKRLSAPFMLIPVSAIDRYIHDGGSPVRWRVCVR
jgi:hypothetical protein